MSLAGTAAVTVQPEPAPQSLKQRIITGVFWLAATKALGQAVTWAITIFVVRLLAPQDYGLMGIASLFIAFLLMFNELGLGAAVIQKSRVRTDQLSDLRWAILAMNLLLAGTLIGAAPLFARYFSEPALTSIIRALAGIFVIQGFGVPAACMLQRELQFREKSQAELAGNVAGSVMTLICALAGAGVWSLVTGFLTVQIVTNTLYCYYYPIAFRRSFSLDNVKPFVNFGFNVTGARILSYASSNADSVVIGRRLGATQLGYYGLAFQFSTIPTDKILSIITQVAYPSFAALQKDHETLKRYYLKLVSGVAVCTFPMFIGLFLVADQGVPLLLTSKWAPVVLPLKMLCFVSCLRAIGTLNTPLLMAKGRADVFMYSSALQAVVLPAAFYIGAAHGLVGVALAWLVTWPILFVIITAWTLRQIDVTIGEYASALQPAVLGCAVMIGVVMAVQGRALGSLAPALQLAATCVVGAGTYLAHQVLFNRRVVDELGGLIRPSTTGTPDAAGAAAPK
jgi:O-antigen/teichoic acid export membrane protein